MPSTPLLSVFMPVFNAEAWLSKALESILSQTFTDFELIVVDDGSSDRSVEIIRSFSDSRLRLIQQDNLGCYPARNRAIQEARGAFLANMDADDISLPDRFQAQVDYLREYPEAILVGTASLGCDREDVVRLPQPMALEYDPSIGIPHVLTAGSTLFSSPFTCATILFRKELAKKIGGYDERLCFSADVDFVIRASFHGRIACLPIPLYVFRLLPHAISGAGSLIQREILAISAAATQRALKGEIREYTESEIQRLAELAEQRRSLPSVPLRKKNAFYETRLATLLRVNGYPREALLHLILAILSAPENLFTDRKLASNVVKGFRDWIRKQFSRS
ncbi:MAG: glycosyltransferase [Candidatus Omnitrophica bacterium]|nr:glycosyltransferase [Candidatus Omnitrophota bacterium]